MKEERIILILVPEDMSKVQNFMLIQGKICDYLGKRMIKEMEETSPAIELYSPLTVIDHKNLNDILDNTGFVVLEFVGDDFDPKYDNILRITNAKENESQD